MENTELVTRVAGYSLQPIASSPLFRGLDRPSITMLQQQHSLTRRAERDTQLIQAMDPAAPLVTIVRGWAFRYSVLADGRRQILSFALPGDTIGLDTLLTGASAYAAQTAAPVVYAEMSRDRVMRLLRDVSWFHDRALQALALERTEAERALIRMGQCNAEERVASVLLEFYDRLAGRGLAASNQFMLDFTQQHFADYLGLTVVHLNRTLGRLRSRRLFSLSGHTVTLLDMPGLKRLALTH